MQLPCPNCKRLVDITGIPVRKPTNSEAWMCIMCPTPVCIWCYHVHTRSVHSESYKGSKETLKRHTK